MMIRQIMWTVEIHDDEWAHWIATWHSNKVEALKAANKYEEAGHVACICMYVQEDDS